MPQYLLNRQEKWRQAEERRAKNRPDPNCPKGHVRLTEEERLGLVGAVEGRRQKLIDETNRMSVRAGRWSEIWAKQLCQFQYRLQGRTTLAK